MRSKYTKFVLLTPAVLILLLTSAYPLLNAFLTSLREWRLNRSPRPVGWVGLENYMRAFGDSAFINSIVVTFSFTVLSVVLSLVIGLAMALLLQKPSTMNMIVKAMLIFPFAISPALKGFSWRFMLNPSFGIYSAIIGTIFPPAADMVWLGTPFWALFWLAMSEVWGWAPLIAL